jgi:adenylosuccinate synthase
MKAHVVIGANYGDEGKGLMTDYLSNEHNAKWIVRFNGGAQAGHTVVTPGGRRHVFSHFGAGTFTGAHTYLGREFVCNPILFRQEVRTLRAAIDGSMLRVMVHKHAQVTTHIDMMFNQVMELIRDRDTGQRHGSCGVGFGETVERAQYEQFATPMKSIMHHRSWFAEHLAQLLNEWVPMRAQQLGITDDPIYRERLSVCTQPELLAQTVDDMMYFAESVWVVSDAGYLRNQQVVFEGAQGLALDMDRGAFPHVTRSNTGIKNVLPICEEAGIDELETVYVTRWYLTRHGAGPLPQEMKLAGDFAQHDTTNVPHPFQGELRFAPLHEDARWSMKYRIDADLKDWLGYAEPYAKPDGVAKLAVTWLDHAPLGAPLVQHQIAAAVGLPLGYTAHGPHRGAVRACSPG